MNERAGKQYGDIQPDMFQRFLVDLYENAYGRVFLYEDYYRSYSFWYGILRSLSFLIGIPITESILGLQGISFDFDSEVVNWILLGIKIFLGLVFLSFLIFDVFLGLGRRCNKFESLIEDVREVKFEVRMLWYDLYGEGEVLDEGKRRRYFLLLDKMDRICSDDNDAFLWWNKKRNKKYKRKLDRYMGIAEAKTREILFE